MSLLSKLSSQWPIGFNTQDCSLHKRDGCMGWHWCLLMTTPWCSLPHHPSAKKFFPYPLFNPHSTCPGLGLWCNSPHLSWDCVNGTLLAGTVCCKLILTFLQINSHSPRFVWKNKGGGGFFFQTKWGEWELIRKNVRINSQRTVLWQKPTNFDDEKTNTKNLLLTSKKNNHSFFIVHIYSFA